MPRDRFHISFTDKDTRDRISFFFYERNPKDSFGRVSGDFSHLKKVDAFFFNNLSVLEKCAYIKNGVCVFSGYV